jgi:hypothetical protein
METESPISENKQENLLATRIIDSDPRSNPFPGLRSFREGEEHLFFGREKHTDELLKKLRTTKFLTVIGEAGSGKSSLIRVGIFPSLYSGFMVQAGSSWRIASMRPGHDPIRSLAEAISTSAVLQKDKQPLEMIETITETILRRSDLGLAEAVKEANLPENENILIFVDQFEEIFSLSQIEKNNQQVYRDSIMFVNLLLNAARQKEMPIYVILSLRSDFLGDCTEFRGLPEAINEGQYLIPRMGRDEIRTVILNPLAIKGVKMTQRLETQLLNDFAQAEDQLPMLQQALRSTWDYWMIHKTEDEPLDLPHYNAIGTIKNAISQVAEEAYSELVSNRNMRICDLLLVALTRKLSGDRLVRYEATLLELCELTDARTEEIIEVISKFKKPGRDLLIFNLNNRITAESTVTICHETLLFQWLRFKTLLDEERSSVEIYLKLVKAAQAYDRGEGNLLQQTEIFVGLSWKQANKPNLAWAKRYHPDFYLAMNFLKESKDAFDNSAKQKDEPAQKSLSKNKILIYLLVILIVLLFIIVVQMLSGQ